MAKPKCKVVGGDGNVFAVISAVKNSLKKAGKVEEAKEFIEKAFKAKSYGEVFLIAEEYVQLH